MNYKCCHSRVVTIDEAIRFFPREEKLGQALWQLQQVGLGYLRLGQPATTLSGGETQRLKAPSNKGLDEKDGAFCRGGSFISVQTVLLKTWGVCR